MMYFSNSHTIEDIKTQYRRMAMVLHPDTGGSHGSFIDLNEQYNQALRSVVNAP